MADPPTTYQTTLIEYHIHRTWHPLQRGYEYHLVAVANDSEYRILRVSSGLWT